MADKAPCTGLAFYDLDGTLVSSNVVTQYVWFMRNQPSHLRAAFKLGKLILLVPFLIALDWYSRHVFNVVFYREYRGLSESCLRASAQAMFDAMMRNAIYPGAKELVESDRRAGYRAVLVTGSLDFAVEPVVRYLGFDEVVANTLEWENGAATGALRPPIIAGDEKVKAMLRLCGKYNVETMQCKAYSDSLSDLPMLEAVGQPAAANPDSRLRRIASARGWPVLNLKEATHVHHSD
ncbi:MAG: HAD-IB family hydrolase [Acidimicrobiia bacterium]|nr:HAD-IB family hydrolase [Acidimicrobiia bacterium]